MQQAGVSEEITDTFLNELDLWYDFFLNTRKACQINTH